MPEDERQQPAAETAVIATDNNAEAAMGEPAPEDNTKVDTIPVDKNQERQAKFKALKERRVI